LPHGDVEDALHVIEEAIEGCAAACDEGKDGVQNESSRSAYDAGEGV
jgi:phosphoribosyl-ATP pyrophosphohydrolase